MGRLVITHSTYVEGLIPLLRALAKKEKIKTITPAVIKKVKGRCPNLELRVSPKILGGYKLMARKGSSAQEVFIVTRLTKNELNASIIESKEELKS